MKERTRKKLITVVIFLIILIALGYLIGVEYNKWWQVRKEYIEMGFASDKFPFKMYTEEELARKGIWPVESPTLINMPTRRRPEQTYVEFREALINEDFKKAAGYFIKEQQDSWLESLKEIKQKGYLKEMLDDLPEKLEDTYFYTDDVTGKDTKNRDLDHTAMSSYYYVLKDDPERMAHVISFVKNWDGDWLIEDL